MFALATCHRQHHNNQPTLHGQSQARWRYDEYIYLLLLCSNGKQEGAIMQRVFIFFSQCCALQPLFSRWIVFHRKELVWQVDLNEDNGWCVTRVISIGGNA